MILVGPPPLPGGTVFPVTFHFGPEDGHTCDRAIFDWYLNGVFVQQLNFNNATLPEGQQSIWIGPIEINPNNYSSNRCASLIFSFKPKALCVLDGSCEPHDGANIDVTAWNGSVVTHYIFTIDPTEFTICELMTGSGRVGDHEEDPP